MNRIGLTRKHLAAAFCCSMLSLILLHACKDGGDVVDLRPPGLYARIVAASGARIADAHAHYIFYTSTNAVIQNVAVRYSLSSPRKVTVRVVGPFGQEVEVLVNAQQQQPGLYDVLFDSAVTNGMYTFVLQLGDTLSTQPFFMRTDDVGQLIQRPPLIMSDGNGEFFLSADMLGIGRRFPGQFADEVIADSISIVLTATGYQTLVQGIRINPAKPLDRTFTMSSQ